MSIVAEAPGWLQVFSDGTVKRFAPEIAPPSADPAAGFKSRDVVIDQSKRITGRVFVPADYEPGADAKLPVVVYFHGGGFCIGSTTWLGYHVFLGQLSAAAACVVLSVDYRLAPEHKLPTAYEDCHRALEWLWEERDRSDNWLDRADLSHVFLAGDSAGGNIVHNVAVGNILCKSFTPKFDDHPLRIKFLGNGSLSFSPKGLILIHPYFGSERRTPKEAEADSSEEVAMNDMFWKLSLPEGTDRDYPGSNYEKLEVGAGAWRRDFPATVVFVAEVDFLKERGVMYAEFLKREGVVDVELAETKNESHVFHVFRPDSEATRVLTQQIVEFMSRRR
uniref:Alpha/beta hydrolase fold-3 domain-containing protein n=1 Tax=Kalanchoe fedtschenkoi TaxID=63787 RepID=A0A7N0V075_KALFE